MRVVAAAHVVADTASDLELKNAFVRNGLALDQAQVMGCSSHESDSLVSQDQEMRADQVIARVDRSRFG